MNRVDEKHNSDKEKKKSSCIKSISEHGVLASRYASE